MGLSGLGLLKLDRLRAAVLRADDNRSGEFVMPALLLGVERYPDDTEPQRDGGDVVAKVTSYRLRKTYTGSVQT